MPRPRSSTEEVICLLAQFERFDSGQYPQQISLIKRRGAQSRRIESVVGDDEKVAIKAPLKLDIGDVGEIGALAQMSSPESLPAAIADFLSLVLSGGVPQQICGVIFDAKSHVFRKKSGGLHPIAVGLTLRKLASKITSDFAIERLLHMLFPRLLGMGAHRGAEAILRRKRSINDAARAFINSSSPCHALVKHDRVNTLRKDSILKTVAADIIPK